MNVMRRTTSLAVATFICGLVVVAALSGVFSLRATAISHDEPLRVRTSVLSMESHYPVERRFVGRVEARREGEAAFELGGKVLQVYVQDGDHVQQGQRLASLDTAILVARRAELEAELNKARADRSLAHSTLDRVTEAHQLNASSEQDLDHARETLAASLAAFNNVASAIHSIDVRLEKSVLLAPYDAIVSNRYVDEGQVLAVGIPVLKLLEEHAPEVRVSIASDVIDTLHIADTYALEIRGRTVTGTVRSILPTRERNTRGIDVLFSLDVPFNGIRSGDLAELVVQFNERAAHFKVPVSALTEGSRGSWSVFVADRSDQGKWLVVPQQVAIHHQDSQYAYVSGTLEDGQLLISQGVHRVTPGQSVSPLAKSKAR